MYEIWICLPLRKIPVGTEYEMFLKQRSIFLEFLVANASPVTRGISKGMTLHPLKGSNFCAACLLLVKLLTLAPTFTLVKSPQNWDPWGSLQLASKHPTLLNSLVFLFSLAYPSWGRTTRPALLCLLWPRVTGAAAAGTPWGPPRE